MGAVIDGEQPTWAEGTLVAFTSTDHYEPSAIATIWYDRDPGSVEIVTAANKSKYKTLALAIVADNTGRRTYALGFHENEAATLMASGKPRHVLIWSDARSAVWFCACPRSPTSTQAASRTLVDILESLDTVNLRHYSVVGDYCRYERQHIDSLKYWSDLIVGAVKERSAAHQNFLIWGRPGSGKSFFVKEIARSLGSDIEFKELNIAKLNRARLATEIGRIERSKSKKPRLCFLDEIDSYSSDPFQYETCFSALDMSISAATAPEPATATPPVVFVLAGSTTAGIDELAKQIAKGKKGEDLLNRVPGDRRFIIPEFTLLDRMIIAAAHVLDATRRRERPINEVDRFALYYLASSDNLQKPRDISGRIMRAVERKPANETSLSYDDLFPGGTKERDRFRDERIAIADRLQGKRLRIER